MRKLIVWIASVVTVISFAAARPTLLGETSLVAPVTDPHHTAPPVSGIGHSARHGDMLLFTS